MEKIKFSSLDKRLQREIMKLQLAGLFSKEKIMLLSEEDLRDVGDFTGEDIYLIRSLISKSLLPKGFIQASDVEAVYSKKWRTVCLDCQAIDEVLGGGIPSRGITELSGSSGLGKTQFCLQYSLTVQYPKAAGGLGLGAVYLCTESVFPSQRLHQLTYYFPRNGDRQHNFDENIYIDHIASVEDLKVCLNGRLPLLLKKFRAGLLVVDSIAALFRFDYSSDEYMTRTRDIRDIGLQLHKLSALFGLAVLCVNQVSDVPGRNTSVPALGLVWANLVTTKLQLMKNNENQRLFHLISAPHLPPTSCKFIITQQGIQGYT